MKTLVIHPWDSTTRFLKKIYDCTDYTIIRPEVSKKVLKTLIKEHDRIIMLGHGTEYGLIGYNRLVIDSRLVYLLREKVCIGIWCHADKFFNKYGLKGFCTGMFISEYEEAIDYCIDESINVIEKSNDEFADLMGSYLMDKLTLPQVMWLYLKIDSPVVEFNASKLYEII